MNQLETPVRSAPKKMKYRDEQPVSLFQLADEEGAQQAHKVVANAHNHSPQDRNAQGIPVSLVKVLPVYSKQVLIVIQSELDAGAGGKTSQGDIRKAECQSGKERNHKKECPPCHGKSQQ